MQPILAVEIDADWFKGLAAAFAIVIAAGSVAYVRMYRVVKILRNETTVVNSEVDTVREQRRTKRDSIAWKRVKDLIAEQRTREIDLEHRLNCLIEEVARYRVEAAQCKEREAALLLREKERDERERERDKKIKELEDRLGIGSKEHIPLKEIV